MKPIAVESQLEMKYNFEVALSHGYMPAGTVCYNGRGKMNIIKNSGSEPTMTVGNKSRVAITEGWRGEDEDEDEEE